ncbi:MAG: hypothetical protein J6S21_08045 [Victivallales bacterium]|nr:hypothetical protein [Victivallales bacterium]
MAMKLCGGTEAVTDWTFAASWGIWDAETRQWNTAAAEKLGIPAAMLPKVVPPGTIIGRSKDIPGLPDDIPVTAALGDNQASILATARNAADELFMTIGTGAQLSAVITAEEAAAHHFPPQIELRPFINGQLLAVNAPLCGGKSWAWLGNAVNGILASLGMPQLPTGKLLDMLDDMAMQSECGGMTFTPLFLGERHDPESRARLTGITLENFSLPALARSLAEGIVATLVAPFPQELLARRSVILGSGNCLRLCKSIQAETTRRSGLPVTFNELPEEAAQGAAKLAAQCRTL